MFTQRTVAILSFEGPDVYSQAGGLGVRASELATALAASGAPTYLYFVGDPKKPNAETPTRDLHLRRWCQWISAYHPGGVYDGEWGKLNDYTASVPRAVLEEVVVPANARGERTLVLAEEWHTSQACIALDALLRYRGLRDSVTILWNANNTFGFENVNWPALTNAAAITTVSKFMKHAMASAGVNPLVIPNGIPQRLLDGPPAPLVEGIRVAMRGRPLLAKIGRFDPDKRWLQAIDAVAELKAMGHAPRLLVRGGSEPHGRDVFARAVERGLHVEDVQADGGEGADLLSKLTRSRADVVNLRAFLVPEMLYAIYAAADAVLANSGKEPFGLVGLEVMAAGGLAVCGSTGEEYAEPFVNAIVCDTADGRELATYVASVFTQPGAAHTMRQAGRATAARFIWPVVLGVLERKIDFVDRTR